MNELPFEANSGAEKSCSIKRNGAYYYVNEIVRRASDSKLEIRFQRRRKENNYEIETKKFAIPNEYEEKYRAIRATYTDSWITSNTIRPQAVGMITLLSLNVI
jgi:hypothetical protein